MPDFRYYDVFVPRGYGRKTEKLLEVLRGTDVVAGPVKDGIAEMLRIMSDHTAEDIERRLNNILGEGMATVKESEYVEEVEGGRKGPGGEKCHECGKPIQGDPVYLPVRRTSDPFEPFCQECAVKVHGVPREPGERVSPELEARRMRAKRIVFGEDGDEPRGVAGKALDVRREFSAVKPELEYFDVYLPAKKGREFARIWNLRPGADVISGPITSGDQDVVRIMSGMGIEKLLEIAKAFGKKSDVVRLTREEVGGSAHAVRRGTGIDPDRLEYAFCDDWFIYAQDTESDELYFVSTELWPEWADYTEVQMDEEKAVEKYMLPVAKKKWKTLPWTKA